MSFQAYLDKVEEITGKAPKEFVAEAKEKNLTSHKEIIEWLKTDYSLGMGHARAIAHVILHGSEFTVKLLEPIVIHLVLSTWMGRKSRKRNLLHSIKFVYLPFHSYTNIYSRQTRLSMPKIRWSFFCERTMSTRPPQPR